MSTINFVSPNNINTIQQQQPVTSRKVKQDFIPLVTKLPEEEKFDINNKTVIDLYLEQLDSITEWFDRVSGLDKVKEYQRLKAGLVKIMDENNIKYSEIDLDYWAGIIDENSKKSNLSKELLISLVQRETGFCKYVGSKTGNGPLQVTSITVQDLFSDLNGGRLVHYNNIDKAMMDEILYKEDIAGNKTPRFNDFRELHKACANDDDLGMKVGIMCFKMKFVEAVARKKGLDIAKVIEDLKTGKMVLSKQEQSLLVRSALINFNSVFNEEYVKAVMDSLVHISKEKDIGDLIQL